MIINYINKNIDKEQLGALPNGLICRKGGELEHETYPMKNKVEIVPVASYFSEPYFETKQIVYLPL